MLEEGQVKRITDGKNLTNADKVVLFGYVASGGLTVLGDLGPIGLAIKPGAFEKTLQSITGWDDETTRAAFDEAIANGWITHEFADETPGETAAA